MLSSAAMQRFCCNATVRDRGDEDGNWYVRVGGRNINLTPGQGSKQNPVLCQAVSRNLADHGEDLVTSSSVKYA